MDAAILFFLSSGLFLGWSLGANDAANVFGTAVGTRMIHFATAAVICSVFVILGAMISGGGAAHTLGRLGEINALPGAFMVALSAALAVYVMTRAGLPVSTTQAIVGGIIGWNLFSDTTTDASTLIKILSTWLICPLLAAVFAVVLYKMVTLLLKATKPHLLRLDAYTRLGLLLAGAFGAYSLGANNIANVMGVFVPVSPFTNFSVLGIYTASSTQQLFLLGGLAIAVGVMTYSRRVMMTVGGRLLPLSPVAAWVVVVAHSLVLFIFASQGLEALLAGAGLPTIPLVPVSSSQAIVGAVLGIGLLKGGRMIRWRVLGGIGTGWVFTPLIAGLVCFVGLFFMQNVFNQQVYRAVPHLLSGAALQRLIVQGVPTDDLIPHHGRVFESGRALQDFLVELGNLSDEEIADVTSTTARHEVTVSPSHIRSLDRSWFSPSQLRALWQLTGRTFDHRWQLADALAAQSEDWRPRPDVPDNLGHNKDLQAKLDVLYRTIETAP